MALHLRLINVVFSPERYSFVSVSSQPRVKSHPIQMYIGRDGSKVGEKNPGVLHTGICSGFVCSAARVGC